MCSRNEFQQGVEQGASVKPVAYCRQKAAEARLLARGTRDPLTRDAFIKAEQHWLSLARSPQVRSAHKRAEANAERLSAGMGRASV